MKKDYIYIGVFLFNAIFAYFIYSGNAELSEENKRIEEENRIIQDRNKELKDISIALYLKLDSSKSRIDSLAVRIDSLSKLDRKHIQIQKRNRDEYKKNIAAIDTANVNQLLRILSN